jgi:DNA-directed RNA polymerase subunit M/transcription elongation factor TFIIS
MPQFEHGEKSIWLIPWIKRRIMQNRNLIGIFVGDTGSGKSLSSISLAEQIDPGFSVERIVFTVQDLITLVNSGKLKPGSVVIFDDAGLGVNARLWKNQSSVIFGMLTQGFRYMQIILLITVPKIYFIERQSRNLIHVMFESTDVQGIMKPKLPFPSPYHDDRIWFKYPQIQRGFKKITIKTARFKLPSQPLMEAYEGKKKVYMGTRFKEFEEKLTGRSRDEREGIPLTCHNCGYSWNYTGFLRLATCSNCGSKVYIAEREDRNIYLKCPHCGYIWPFTGTAKRTTCHNCEQKVDTEKNRVPDSDDADVTV